jgi:hypothetical protein
MEVFVKKLTVLILISFFLIGAVYGQGIRDNQGAGGTQRRTERQPRNEQRPNNDSQRRTERQRSNDPITIEGTLKLERGFVAVESGDSVYYVPMLNRYIGFINDLREGTRVSVEGRESRNVIQPTKVTIGGRTYDFLASGHNPGMGAPGFDRRQENVPDRGQLQGRNNPGRGYWDLNQGRRYGPGRGGCCW